MSEGFFVKDLQLFITFFLPPSFVDTPGDQSLIVYVNRELPHHLGYKWIGPITLTKKKNRFVENSGAQANISFIMRPAGL